MFNSIRRTLSAMIAPTPTHKPDTLTTARYQPEQVTIPTQKVAKKQTFDGIEGHLTPDDLRNIGSDTLRKQLFGKLVMSAVASGFNAWLKQNRTTGTGIVEQALNRAAEAVAVADSAGFPADLTPDRWQFLTTGNLPAALTEANAALLADITGDDPAALVAKRKAVRAAKYQSNVQGLELYLNSVEGWVAEPKFDKMGDPIDDQTSITLKGASALAGLASTVEFISTWNDPVRAAAELMLIKRDRQIIEAALKRSAAREAGKAPDYVSRLDDMLLDANGMSAGMQAGK